MFIGYDSGGAGDASLFCCGNAMKFLSLALLALIMIACEAQPSDVSIARQQYQIAAANLNAAVQQQAEYAKATVQAKAAEQESIMATQGAQDVEIRQIQIEASATMSAIDRQAAAASLANQATLSARISAEYGLQATQEWQAAQATATAVAGDMILKTAKVQRAQANADFWSNLLPTIAQWITLVMGVLSVIFLIYVGYRVYLDIGRHRANKIHNDLKQKFVTTSAGKFYFPDEKSDPILQIQLTRQFLLEPGEEDIIPDDEDEDAPPVTNQIFDLRGEAIRMIDASINNNGNTEQLPGWRLIPGYNSDPWKEIKNYLVSMSLVYKKDDRKYYAVSGTLADVRYKLVSTAPTPRGNVN